MTQRAHSSRPDRNGDQHWRPNDRGEDEEGQARSEQQVADGGDGLDYRDRDGDDVGQRAAVGEEAGVHRAGQQDVEARMHGARIEAGGGQAGLPDRHPTAVDDDGDPVGHGAERGGRQPGQVPVGQQHGREQHVRDQDQPHPHGVRNAARGESGI